MKLNCPSYPPADPLQLLPRSLTQLYAYLEKLLQISFFFFLPGLSGTLGLVWREGANGSPHWKPWEELEVTCSICSVQHSDKLIILNQDFFSLVGKGLLFFWRMGSVSSSLTPVTIFDSKKAGNIGTFHLARALE